MRTSYTNCDATDPPPNETYDPRCRPWYAEGLLPENANKAVLAEPYLGLYKETMYVSITSQNPLEDLEAVSAIDLNMSNYFFQKTISKYIDEHIEFYFFATAEQMVMQASNMETISAGLAVSNVTIANVYT